MNSYSSPYEVPCTHTACTNEKPRRSLTSEEAENVTGMVANRRALFESNKTASTHQAGSYTRPVSQQRPISNRNTIDTSAKTISGKIRMINEVYF